MQKVSYSQVRVHQTIIPSEILESNEKELQIEKFKLLMLLIVLSVSPSE